MDDSGKLYAITIIGDFMYLAFHKFCEAKLMDSVQHAYAPALAILTAGGDTTEAIVAASVAVLPDAVEQFNKWKGDKSWAFYLDMHSDLMLRLTLGMALLTFLASMTSTDGRWYHFIIWAGYSLHLFLDKFTHKEGKRWWIPSERLWANDWAWITLGSLATLVNVWLAVGGLIWGLGVTLIQRSKYV